MKEKAKKLLELRKKISEIKETLLIPIEQERDEIQDSILQELKETEQFSARYDFATITRAVRKTPKVVDEKEVISFLEKSGLAKDYVTPQLNDIFPTYMKESVKQGIKIDGEEVFETEYISISESSKEDRRKISIE